MYIYSHQNVFLLFTWESFYCNTSLSKIEFVNFDIFELVVFAFSSNFLFHCYILIASIALSELHIVNGEILEHQNYLSYSVPIHIVIYFLLFIESDFIFHNKFRESSFLN
jgi:hypothetical protein